MVEEPRDFLAELRGTDPQARDAALDDLRDYLRRTLARGFGNSLSDSDLEDLTQDSLVKIHTRLSSFAGRSKFTTWAASIAVRTALSELRRRKHKPLSLELAVEAGQSSLEPAEPPAAPEALQRASRDELLREAIATALTERQRTALTAKLAGLPLEEVARRIGSSRGATYKLLHDARKRLLAYFRDRGLEAEDLLSSEDS